MSKSNLLIASHNEGKIAELRKMIAPLAIELLSATDVDLNEPEESGTSFAENAELKARNAYNHSNMAALADDSGIVIPALDGAPGIYSARWAGADKDFSVAFTRIESELAAKNIDSHTPAYFISMLCLCDENGVAHFFEGRIDGMLTFPAQGEHGFGYDPIFTPNGYDITFAQMNAEHKNVISHRANAFEKFITFMNNKK